MISRYVKKSWTNVQLKTQKKQITYNVQLKVVKSRWIDISGAKSISKHAIGFVPTVTEYDDTNSTHSFSVCVNLSTTSEIKLKEDSRGWNENNRKKD